MSSREATSRLALRLSLVAAIGLATAGCFQPLYGTAVDSATPTPAVEGLRSVDVAAATDRISLEIRNRLVFRLGGGGPTGGGYMLDIRNSVAKTRIIEDESSSLVNTASVQISSTFTLSAPGIPEPVYKGTALGRSVFSRSVDRYANIRAERDAEDRAAEAVAEQVYTKLAIYFAKGAPLPTPVATAVPAPAAK